MTAARILLSASINWFERKLLLVARLKISARLIKSLWGSRNRIRRQSIRRKNFFLLFTFQVYTSNSHDTERRLKVPRTSQRSKQNWTARLSVWRKPFRVSVGSERRASDKKMFMFDIHSSAVLGDAVPTFLSRRYFQSMFSREKSSDDETSMTN